MSDCSIFNLRDCKEARDCFRRVTADKFNLKIREMWIGVFLFPVSALTFIILLHYIGASRFKINPALGVFFVLGWCFFSYVVWLGTSDLRETLNTRRNLANKALCDLEKIEFLLAEKSKFVLYLRDYENGVSPYYASNVKMPSFVGGYAPTSRTGSLRLEKVTSHLRDKIPIVMLHNSRDETNHYFGHVLFCSDEKWFQSFEILARNASMTIVDYSGSFEDSEAVMSELSFLRDKELPVAIIGTNEEISRLQSLGLSAPQEGTIHVTENYGVDRIVVRNEYFEEVKIPELFLDYVVNCKSCY